jgi:uncharacterized protein with HEPN domain
MNERDEELLLDIIDAIRTVQAVASGGRASIEERVNSYALIGSFAVIGEAINRLSPEIKAAHPEIAWEDVVRFRHFMVHHYIDIDHDRVWQIIRDDLPVLSAQITELLGGQS